MSRPPLPSYRAAVDGLRRAAADARAARPDDTTVDVPLAAAVGRVLARPVRADRDLPPFNRAAMDGYAVRARDVAGGAAPATLPVTGAQPAGAPLPSAGPPGDAAGTAIRISTGAAVPPAFDAVVPHERTDRGNPVTIDAADVAPGAAVHPRGADARRGDVLVAAGTRLGPVHIGLAATVGHETMAVVRRPRTAVLTTGRELRGPGDAVADHQIRNSNGPQLAGLLPELGAHPDVASRHVDDDEAATRAALADLAAAADVICTVGGISAGEHDHVAGAIESMGGRFVLRGAAIQPGKPIAAAILPPGERGGAPTVVICLPGNPVSALACAILFAWPVLRDALGQTAPRDADHASASETADGTADAHTDTGAAIPPGGDLPWILRPLAAPVRPNPRRTAFRPARSGFAGVTVPSWAGSGDLAHTAITDGLVHLPMGDAELPTGTPAAFLAWPGPAASPPRGIDP